MLVGNVVALIFVPLLTLIKPELVPYDFVSMRAIELVDDGLPNPNQSTIEEIEHRIMHLTQKCRLIRIVAIGLRICLNIIWLWPMYGTSYIFSIYCLDYLWNNLDNKFIYYCLNLSNY
jgi:hypothetical protein